MTVHSQFKTKKYKAPRPKAEAYFLFASAKRKQKATLCRVGRRPTAQLVIYLKFSKNLRGP